MSEEQFEAEKDYQISIHLAKTLRQKGLLSDEEYAIIDTKLQEKYRPLFGTLLSENDLL
ncbi:SHOCT domain-containing protein [Dehalobacter sp.]|uniref:SHOCT domain-containing protein n=1 Tax=Dehalobacter sp. TaxID=1962289 RepID=UPI00258E21FF|nr:SHOCT domain-containing protein [Dehalobacter sp.]MDJ0304687.1 hypothetical protein [Dehalobacter sp.]